MLFSLHRVAGWPSPAPLLRLPIRHLSWAAFPRPSGIIAAARVECASYSSFDLEAFEAKRLRLDAEARASMAAAAAASDKSVGEGGDPKDWKWKIRKRVWDLLEAENIARNPRPVHHRIPNFDGAAVAADVLGKLDVFEKAQCVKVNPDSPQKQVRFLTLPGGKKLLTPQPRLRTGFFSVLESKTLTSGGMHFLAVDPRTGARLGKGEGFAELEYGRLRYMGAIDDNTMIVTSVHDKQLVSDIPVEKLLVHDVPVDIICTPTEVIYTNTKIPKPQGIYWDKLSPEKLGQIRILRELKKRIERETGQARCPLGLLKSFLLLHDANADFMPKSYASYGGMLLEAKLPQLGDVLGWLVLGVQTRWLTF